MPAHLLSLLFFRSAVYRSATAIVIEFFDVGAADDYAKLFVEADESKDGLLQLHELESAAGKLGLSLDVLALRDEQVDQKTFVAKCTQLLGAERKVVLKFMQARRRRVLFFFYRSFHACQERHRMFMDSRCSDVCLCLSAG